MACGSLIGSVRRSTSTHEKPQAMDDRVVMHIE